MKTKYLLGALALAIPTAAFAHEPATTAEHECCCCKEGEHGEMPCCEDSAEQTEGEHAEHAEHAEGGEGGESSH